MKGNTGLQSSLQIVSIPTAIILMFLAKPLAQKFGKKKLICFCEIIGIISSIIVLAGGASVPAVIASSLIGAIPLSLCNMMCRTALLDVASYTQVRTGVNAGGLFSSTFTFTNKLMQAVASYAAGWLLSLIAFDATAQTQSAGTLQGILILRTVTPIIAYVITLIAMRFYPIDKKAEMQLQDDLDRLQEMNDEF